MSELRKITFNGRDALPAEQAAFAHEEFTHVQEHAAVYTELDKLKKDIEWDVFWKIIEEIGVKSGIDVRDINRLHHSMIVGQRDLKIKEDKNETGGAKL